MHCNKCEYSCDNMELLNRHLEAAHKPNATNNSIPHLCYKCDETFPYHSDLAAHVMSNHVQQLPFSCDPRGDNLLSISNTETHSKARHEANYSQAHNISALDLNLDGAFLPQLDGNDTITSASSTSFATRFDSEIPYPGTSSDNLIYNYSLNTENQTRRLVENASKPPIKVSHKNPKLVDGVEYATDVIIECSSGLYLTAIKPTLESVDVGWRTEVLDWIITCNNLSNRNDNQKQHLLCTQLSLTLSNKNLPESSHKATLHFYHTQDKIQIQGSSILSPGVTSATWLSSNLIEPLAAAHIATNQESIIRMNEAILASAHGTSHSCTGCSSIIQSNSKLVRDQPMTCGRCGNPFHKRCTNK